MPVGVISGVIMAVLMHMPGALPRRASIVSAGFGVEGQMRSFDRAAQMFDHLREHRIGLDEHIVGRDLCRHMAIGQVVDDAHQGMRGIGGDAQHRLRRGFDTHQAAIGRAQPIAIAQDAATRKHDADLAPVSQHRDETAFDAQVVAGTQARGLRAHRALGRRIGTLAHLQGLGHRTHARPSQNRK